MLNLSTLKTPGVYIDEVPLLPPSVAAVETGIPAFVGYTENIETRAGKNLVKIPTRITSFLDYKELFGGPKFESDKSIELKISDLVDKINAANPNQENLISREIQAKIDPVKRSKFNMYYAVQWYFANGGGPCYIVSAGTFKTTPAINTPDSVKLKEGVTALEAEDEPTMIVVSEAAGLDAAAQKEVYEEALKQANLLGDRMLIMDVRQAATKKSEVAADMTAFRTSYTENRMYGAAYYPYINTSIDFEYDTDAVNVIHKKKDLLGDEGDGAYHDSFTAIKGDNVLYEQVKTEIGKIELVLPPSPVIAAVWAKTDAERGVWKAPANVGLASTIGPAIKIDDETQKNMNVDPASGKSVNAIRQLTGRGTVVWGARTLLGESNEWRYINVRRFFNFVEESVKKSTYRFVFEPNDANTWISIRAMIENFLTLQWRAGALQGSKPEQAFFVRVGLGQTMTALDILEGRLIVEIGMAVVRPAEFIILRFMHKLPEA